MISARRTVGLACVYFDFFVTLLEALEALYRALNRGNQAARVNLAQVLGTGAFPSGKPPPPTIRFRWGVMSMEQETNGNLWEA